MIKEEVLSAIRVYLKHCKLMQVAVSVDNNPRIFNCWFSHDDNLHFYYISPPEAKHSSDLSNNNQVGVSIVSPEIAKLGVGEKIQGLMFEGRVEMVKGRELIHAYKNFLTKYPKVVKYIQLIGEHLKMDGTCLYKIIPEKGVWFDAINSKGKQEIVF